MSNTDLIEEPGVILRLKDYLNPYQQAMIGRLVVRQALERDRRTAYFSLTDCPGTYEREEVWTEYVKRTGRNVSMRAFRFESPDCAEDERVVHSRMAATDGLGERLLSVVEGKTASSGYSIVGDVIRKAQQGFNLMVIVGDGLCDNYHLKEFREVVERYGATIVIFN